MKKCYEWSSLARLSQISGDLEKVKTASGVKSSKFACAGDYPPCVETYPVDFYGRHMRYCQHVFETE